MDPPDNAEPARDPFLDQALAFDLDDRPTWAELHAELSVPGLDDVQ